MPAKAREQNPLRHLDNCMLACVVVFHAYWFVLLSRRYHESGGLGG